MASAYAPNEPGQLDIDGVLGASLVVWPRLMLAFGPIYALQVLPDVVQGQIRGVADASLETLVVADVFGLVLSILCLGALNLVAAEVLDGGQPRILAAVSAATRRFFPILGVACLAGLVMLAGFALLLVPGFIVATWYFVVVPVCVLEGLGPAESLRRSAALSKGARWRIFGLLVVVAVAGLVALACTRVAEAQIGGIWAAAVNVLATTAAGIFAGTVAVATYRALSAPRPVFEASRFGDV